MENGGQVKSWNGHGGGVAAVEFARDGRLVSVGRDRVAKLWDQNGQVLKQFEGFGDITVATTFCDESNRVIAGDWTGSIRVFDAVEGTMLGSLQSNPPTLAERLHAAQQAVAARQAELAPL